MCTVYNMNGRRVFQIPISNEPCFKEHRCNDCGGSPIYRIVEIDKFTPGFDPIVESPRAVTWIWCGECDVGG